MYFRHSHITALPHHVQQAEGWLHKSDSGTKTAALSYAALELRYAIERLAVYYWVSLLNRPLTHAEAESLGTYKKLERRIYDLAGHQKAIDGNFAFLRAVMGVMKIPNELPTPNLGRLSEHWHACSEICHVAWPLSCSVELYRQATFEQLTEIQKNLVPLVSSNMIGWPVIHEKGFAELRDRFVAGHASAAEIQEYANMHGLWARVHDKDDRQIRFIGEAIPPRTPSPRDDA